MMRKFRKLLIAKQMIIRAPDRDVLVLMCDAH